MRGEGEQEWNLVGMKEGGRGEGRLRGGTFIIIHVLILNILEILCNIFPVFNACSCFNEFL